MFSKSVNDFLTVYDFFQGFAPLSQFFGASRHQPLTTGAVNGFWNFLVNAVNIIKTLTNGNLEKNDVPFLTLKLTATWNITFLTVGINC